MSSGFRREERMSAEDIVASMRKLDVEGADQGLCSVRDVSDCGVRVRMPHPPNPGQKVDLRVGVEEEIFSLLAEVRWVRPAESSLFDVGLEFAPDEFHRADFVWAFLTKKLDKQREKDAPTEKAPKTPPRKRL